mgnify:CR=1 FL=1
MLLAECSKALCELLQLGGGSAIYNAEESRSVEASTRQHHHVLLAEELLRELGVTSDIAECSHVQLDHHIHSALRGDAFQAGDATASGDNALRLALERLGESRVVALRDAVEEVGKGVLHDSGGAEDDLGEGDEVGTSGGKVLRCVVDSEPAHAPACGEREKKIRGDERVLIETSVNRDKC